MIDAMKSVPPDSVFNPAIRTGIDRRWQRHLAVKPGVENGYLRHRAEKIFDNFHAFELSANVQWSNRGDLIDCGPHFLRQYCGLSEVRTTVNHTVPHNVNFRGEVDGPCLPTPHGAQQVTNGLLPGRNRQLFLVGRSLMVLHRNRHGMVTPLNPSFPQGSRWRLWRYLTDLIEAGF